MNLILIAAFTGPIGLVLTLYAFNQIFRGWKTNMLGVFVTALGGLQSANLMFMPQDVSSALMAGSGVAILVASKLTERVKNEGAG